MADLNPKYILSRIRSDPDFKKAAFEAVFVQDPQNNANYRNPWYTAPQAGQPSVKQYFNLNEANDCLDNILAESPGQGQDLTPKQAFVVWRFKPSYCKEAEKRFNRRGIGCLAGLAGVSMLWAAFLMPALSNSHANELRSDARKVVWYVGGCGAAAGLALYAALRYLSRQQNQQNPQNPNQPHP